MNYRPFLCSHFLAQTFINLVSPFRNGYSRVSISHTINKISYANKRFHSISLRLAQCMDTFVCIGADTTFVYDSLPRRWQTCRRYILVYPLRTSGYATLSFVFQGTLLLVSLFVPLRIGTPLFTVGCVLFAFALVGFMAAFHAYASTPKGETVVRGVYRLSRNPMYFFYEVGALAVCIASASLWLLLATIPLILVTHGVILGEERYCMTTYGEDYARYKARTPRYFLLK